MKNETEDLQFDDRLLEVYKQSNENARAFMNLRLRHFAAFAVIMVFIASAAFKVDRLENFSIPILFFGVIMTVLFWLLDYRTGEFLRHYAKRSSKLEKSILKGAMSAPPQSKYIGASGITNLIFGFILFGWLFLMVLLYIAPSTPGLADSAKLSHPSSTAQKTLQKTK